MKSYRYIDGVYEYSFEIKHSKFIATVSGELDSDGAEEFVKSVKKRYSDATHNCYAYISDVSGNATRFSDDGEPSGTAGQPILGVIQKRGLVRSAVVVTRYFGGIKLGAGGLVSAYTDAASKGIDSAVVSEKVECAELNFSATYEDYAVIEALTRRSGFKLGGAEYGQAVSASVHVPLDLSDGFIKDVLASTSGRVQPAVGQTLFVKL